MSPLARIIVAILVILFGPWLLGFLLPSSLAWVISIIIAIAIIVSLL